jgi:hypothetical protein
MGRSSAGGARAAGGVGHEARCLAWAAVYMITEGSLPDWASGLFEVVELVILGQDVTRGAEDLNPGREGNAG